jgi:PIN domain nuclease of toxin-antitoxin system
MRLLLDTHVVLWVLADAPQLSELARRRIAAAEAVCVSAASIWEVAIKAGLGKIDADAAVLAAAVEASGMSALPVRAEHAAAVQRLPLHHADPFDRLLVAQAQYEPLRLLTADAVVARYGEFIELV